MTDIETLGGVITELCKIAFPISPKLFNITSTRKALSRLVEIQTTKFAERR